MWTGNSVRFSPQTLVDLRSAGKYHSRKRLRTVSSGCSSQSAMWEATLSKEQQRARIMPKDHSASPLSCGLLKSGKVFVSSFVQTYKGSWRDMMRLPHPEGYPPSEWGNYAVLPNPFLPSSYDDSQEKPHT